MTSHPVPLIQGTGLTKHYPGVVALDHVDFTLEAGEVHVLFGENGAGKSTLISILAGATAPTSGTVALGGEPVTIRSVKHARQLGISAVFQEFSLVPTQTVAENLVLGGEPRWGPFLDHGEARRRARALFAELEFDIDPGRLVSQLSRGEQQMVEIAKALRDEMRVLILDEPTASLTDRETDHLFALIGRLKQRGIGMIYISHRVHEFARIADRISVLRDGRLSGTVPAKDASEALLLSLMVGRDLGAIYPTIRRSTLPPLLVVERLRAWGVDDVSFDIRPGEVTGCAGLVGSGKSRVWRAIMGLNATLAGRVKIGDRDITGTSTRVMMGAGVFYLPPDRKTEGLMPAASSADNIMLGIIGGRDPMPRRGKAMAIVSAIAARVALDRRHLRQLVSQLSGGNQQKVMFSKGFGRAYDLYIFDEPTVGVDIGTRAQLYRVIQALAESGKAVVVVSSDLPEVLNLSHRLLVFSAGRISADLTGDAITEAAVLGHFFERRREFA
jgi:ribose transport system ATP-binding protein